MFDLYAMLDWVVAFFTAEIPVLGLGLCRVGVAGAVLVDAVFLARDGRVWLHPQHGVAPADVATRGRSWLFDGLQRIVGQNYVVTAALLVQVALAFFALIGLSSRLTCAALFLTTSSIHLRNPHILYGGDGLARILLLLLACSPCGDSVAVDQYLRSGDWGWTAKAAPWGMRLIQIELCVIYLYNFWLKIGEAAWREGTALYFVWRNPELRLLELPRCLRTLNSSKACTWGTLALELSLPFGLAIAQSRSLFVIVALLFHVAIGLTISVHLFSYLMIAGLCVFVDPTDFGLAGSAAGPGPVTAVTWVGVALCALYSVYIFFWDPPAGRASPTSRAVRRVVRLFPIWAPLHRSWRLFVGDPPGAQQMRLRIVAYWDAVRYDTYGWDPQRGMYLEREGAAVRPTHRYRKFLSAMTMFPAARQWFGKFIVRELSRGERPPCVVLVDLEVDAIAPPSGAQRQYKHLTKGRRNLFTRIQVESGVDPQAVYMELASRTTEQGVATRVLGTLTLLGMRDALLGCSDAKCVSRIRERWDHEFESSEAAEVRELRRVCRLLPTAELRDFYGAIIDGLESPSLKDGVLRRARWKPGEASA